MKIDACRGSRGGLVAFVLLGFSGCAHYYLPANHLETPEVRGAVGRSRFELGALQGGADLNAPATRGAPDEETGEVPGPELQLSPVNYALGFVTALDERTDIGVRMQPYAPLVLRLKRQFAGESEATAAKGNFSFAGVLAPGVLLGGGVTYYTVGLSLPAGYRFWERHLFSLSPFFSFAGISGTPVPAASGILGGGSSGGAAAGNSATISQYGAAFGYQYVVQGLILRAELSYPMGTMGESSLGGITAGGLVGLAL